MYVYCVYIWVRKHTCIESSDPLPLEDLCLIFPFFKRLVMVLDSNLMILIDLSRVANFNKLDVHVVHMYITKAN